jgi:ApbE superfamily uncharacterized protein (UPF0280 family)
MTNMQPRKCAENIIRKSERKILRMVRSEPERSFSSSCDSLFRKRTARTILRMRMNLSALSVGPMLVSPVDV